VGRPQLAKLLRRKKKEKKTPQRNRQTFHLFREKQSIQGKFIRSTQNMASKFSFSVSPPFAVEPWWASRAAGSSTNWPAERTSAGDGKERGTTSVELTISGILQQMNCNLGLPVLLEEPIAAGVPSSGVVRAQDSLSCTIRKPSDRPRVNEVINTPDIETGIPAYSNVLPKTTIVKAGTNWRAKGTSWISSCHLPPPSPMATGLTSSEI